jgi:hypothetical protein
MAARPRMRPVALMPIAQITDSDRARTGTDWLVRMLPCRRLDAETVPETATTIQKKRKVQDRAFHENLRSSDLPDTSGEVFMGICIIYFLILVFDFIYLMIKSKLTLK